MGLIAKIATQLLISAFFFHYSAGSAPPFSVTLQTPTNAVKARELLPAFVLVTGQNGVGLTSPGSGHAKAPFAITIAAESSVVKAGAGVFIKATLANNSNHPLDASTSYCGPSGLDSLFTWEVRDSSERLTAKRIYPHPELATASPILDRILQPRSELSEDQDIGRLYDMTNPGNT